MLDNLDAQLTLLKQEFEKGQHKLQELEQQKNNLRDTLLRISDAIHGIEELLAEENTDLAIPPVSLERVMHF